VTVRVVGAERNQEICVSVADRGIGIAPAEQKHVFDQYYRSSDPLARRKKGTGLGLTIVRYIMEAHGGRVGIDSRQGEGTTFSLHFPLAFVPPGSPSG
jgi:signal transduction histidine kinase